jgi:hypothetical protein
VSREINHYAIVYRDQGKWKVHSIYKRRNYVIEIFPTLLNKTLRQFDGVRIETIDRYTRRFLDDYMHDKFNDPTELSRLRSIVALESPNKKP